MCLCKFGLAGGTCVRMEQMGRDYCVILLIVPEVRTYAQRVQYTQMMSLNPFGTEAQ